MALIGTIESQHRRLFGALDSLEALAEAAAPEDELRRALEEVHRTLVAHEVTAEHFVVGPLRILRLLDTEQLSALRDELEDLSNESAQLATAVPDVETVAHFARATRDHVERKARAVVPAARAAVCERRLPAVPKWFVDDFYALQGGPVESWPEEWLG
jgi:hypothetical protein